MSDAARLLCLVPLVALLGCGTTVPSTEDSHTDDDTLTNDQAPADPTDGQAPFDPGEDQTPPDSPGDQTPSDPTNDQIPADPAEWPRDTQLMGTWPYETHFFDSISGYSSTTSTTLSLQADGTYERRSVTWADTDAINYESGEDVDSGHWGTVDGWLYLVLPNDDYYEYGYYLDQAAGDFVMMMQTEDGSNLLWTYQG